MERPTVQELLRAVRGFLEQELMPELEGVRRFHTRVSLNALAIVLRELELQGAQRPAQFERLRALLGRHDAQPSEPGALDRAVEELERELCVRIRAGFGDQADERARLLAHLRETAAERLAVSNPTHR